MAKNILIYSDGTGQRAGVRVEERRSNIYKMFAASRSGPSSKIDPRVQFAFYDPGIGTLPEGLSYVEGLWRKLYNVISQATGFGITMNIIDCYSAIIQAWEPGDRIYIMGFSRGAYTVRCLASVLVLCGIPTRNRDGSAMKYDPSSVRKIAKEAVKKVYQHVSSPKDTKYVPQREALAREFRAKYQSGSETESNAPPYFIGVFDTVASLMNTGTMILSGSLISLFLSAVSFFLWWALHYSFWPSLSFGETIRSVLAVAAAGIAISFLINNLKFAIGLKGYSFFQTLHWNPARFKFYDRQLSLCVEYARHAISIDEQRANFPREPWGTPKEWPNRKNPSPAWFKQEWFSGGHSDVGGSYPENESRLSDISLKWMWDQAKDLPFPIYFDESLLNVFPDATGMQHDEMKASWIFSKGKRYVRPIDPSAVLHESVLQRFEAKAVLQYDEKAPYRPENLRGHSKVGHFYSEK